MTPLAAAFLALLAAAAGSALLLARRDPRHRPVAWYLCAVVAVDALRWGRSLVLPPATGPREGWELVARHAEQGLYLASILALPALVVVVFGDETEAAATCRARSASSKLAPLSVRLRQIACAIAATWLLLTSYLIADYPALSGAELLRIYELVELGAVLFSGLCFARWLSGPRLLREGPAVACTLALISGPAATVAAPYLTRGTTLEAWPGIVAANGVAVGITLVLQIGALTKRRPKCSCYPS